MIREPFAKRMVAMSLSSSKAAARVLRMLALLAVLVVLGACRQAGPPDEITIALNSAPISLDPHYTNEVTSHVIHSNIFETLVDMNFGSTPVPALAIKWDNPDDLTWTFELSHDVRFHNGDLCTSEDVQYSLLRAKTDPKSDWSGELVAISQIEAPSAYRLVIRTERPYPILLNRISSIAIVPKRYVESHDASALERHPVGSGPYKFVSWDQKTGAVTLERWDRYYKPLPAVRKVHFEAIADPNKRVQALLSGHVDMITDIPLDGYKLIQKHPDMQFMEVSGIREMFLAFDMARETTPYVSTPRNPFLDRRVRLAFVQAIDTKSIVEHVLGGFAAEAGQFAPASVFGYNNTLVRPAFDPEAARKLLAEAGYPNGFAVTLDTPKDTYLSDTAVADAVAESLRAVNVNVTVNKLEKSILFEKETSRDTSFYMLSWSCGSGDMAEIFDYLLHSPDPKNGFGVDNGGQYSNPEVDRLADEAAQIMDPSVRLKKLQAAVAAAAQDFPWAPLYVQADTYGLRKGFLWTPPGDRNIRVSKIEIAH